MRGSVLLLVAFASSAGAQSSFDLGDRRLDVIDDPIQLVFQAPANMDSIREGVERTALSRGWAAVAQGPGRWELMKETPSSNQAKVAVLCDTASCSMQYLESTNLLYRDRMQSGSPLRAIHKTYNNWVRDLARSLAGATGARVIYGYAPLTDAEAVPFLRPSGRKAYEDFLKRPKPRAFAVAANGAWGYSAPEQNPSYALAKNLDVVRRAMERCEQRGEGTCKLYAVDDRVVWEPR